MSEPPLPRIADPAPRSALLARAAARPRPGLATAVVCALTLAVGPVHSMVGPAAPPVEGAVAAAAVNAGSGQAVQHAPAAVVRSVATRRCRQRRATSRRAARAVARCAPVPARRRRAQAAGV